jgi:hypothetical protein
VAAWAERPHVKVLALRKTVTGTMRLTILIIGYTLPLSYLVGKSILNNSSISSSPSD